MITATVVETKFRNSRGTSVRRVQMVERSRVIELSFQRVHGTWLQYKRQMIWAGNELH